MYKQSFGGTGQKRSSSGGSRFSSRTSGGRPSFGGSRGGVRGSRSGGSRGGGARGGRGSRFKDRSFSDVSKFINKVSITEEAEVYMPEHAFIDFQVEDALKANIVAKGYKSPTPIQDKAIPHILKGEDVVGIANTGTGKTAAFLIPLINKILKNPKENVLVVVPTRELAIQIEVELRGFTRNMNIYSVCVVGGAPMGPQMRALRYKNNFIIGTPGRLKDLIERKCIRLNEFSTVVLDEADRMLDMGFINDIQFMMDLMPKERHTLFFSATLSNEINALISKFLKTPVTISVKTRDTSKSIDQDVVRLRPGENKLDTLQKMLNEEGFSKILIFGKTKHGVEKLSKMLIQMGFSADSIHGNKTHGKRQRALGQFKNNQLKILVATDVAARGLDIADVSHVINFDLPATYEDYIHRIGRTGRGGKKGKALTFIE